MGKVLIKEKVEKTDLLNSDLPTDEQLCLIFLKRKYCEFLEENKKLKQKIESLEIKINNIEEFLVL